MATIQDRQDKIDEVMARAPVVLDLEQLIFLDSSAMHCVIKTWQTWQASGHPVVLHNTSPSVRRILDLGTVEPEAWVFDGESSSSDTE